MVCGGSRHAMSYKLTGVNIMMIQYFDDRADREWLGIVPEFFARGVVAARFEGGGISTVSDEMNAMYGMGGFSDHWRGDIDDDGVYRAPEDEPLEPFARVDFNGWTMWAYPYSIFGIKDSVGNQRVGRFD